MLSKEKQMDVLEAYDLTQSLRAAAQLTGVDHHTVLATWPLAPPVGPSCVSLSGPGSDGFAVCRRWSALVARSGRCRPRPPRGLGSRSDAPRGGWWRSSRPPIAMPTTASISPGSQNPASGSNTTSATARPSGARRVVLRLVGLEPLPGRPPADRSHHGLGRRRFGPHLSPIGGASTYVLTDNEKTVTDRHIAGIPVRNESMVATANYYGVTICTCVPYDPESKGGSESTVKIAKADLVPTEANLLDEYASFAAFEVACAAAMDTFNGRLHAVTRRVPSEALARVSCLPPPSPPSPYTAAFGESRRVGWSSTISFRGVRYSVPHRLCDTRVWVRQGAGEVIIVAGEGKVPPRWPATGLPPGGSSICDEHYPERRGEPRERRPRPTSRSEEQFLALGEGAQRYLIEGAAAGARRLEARMAEAVCLAALHGAGPVDEALGLAAMAGRFWEGDLESILVHAAGALVVRSAPPEGHSLAQGTSSWSSYKSTSGEAQS